MKTVNKSTLFFIILICLFSCNKPTHEIEKSIIDYNADSTIYKLQIIDIENSGHFQEDEYGNSMILIKKNVTVGDTVFRGIFGKENAKILKYANKNMISNGDLITSICIKNNLGNYQEVWVRKDNISFNSISSFGIWDLRISIEETAVEYKGDYREGIKILFKENGCNVEKGGYKWNMLNYIKSEKEDDWILVSRERLNTKINDVRNDRFGYKVDTLNRTCERESNHFVLGDDVVFDLNN